MAATSIYDRRSGRLVDEKVYMQGWLRFLYHNALGCLVHDGLLRYPWFSRRYARGKQRRDRGGAIARFVVENRIDLNEFETAEYASFNDFFIRRIKPSARPLDPDCSRLIAPADSRLLAYPLAHGGECIPVKGRPFTVAELVGSEAAATAYGGGTVLVFRLAPVDYHRYAYIDAGEQSPVRRIGRFLNSVHPIALAAGGRIFAENLRDVCTLHTEHFGEVLEIDVGALTIGSIVQHFPQGGRVARGQEKGYFQFGGSTVILVFRAGAVVLDGDIARHSAQGVETLIRQGEAIGSRGGLLPSATGLNP